MVNLVPAGERRQRSLILELLPATSRDLAASEIDALATLLGSPVDMRPTPCVVDVGPRWIVARLADVAAVIGLQPSLARMVALSATGATVFGCHPPGGPAAIEVRSFAPVSGVKRIRYAAAAMAASLFSSATAA